MKSSFLIFTLFITLGLSFQAQSQCTNCTYSAPSGGTNFSLNGNETLCITANVANLNINLNGSGNKVCIGAGVTWDKPTGGNLTAGLVVDVYGTLNVGTGLNINGTPPNAVINIHPGGVVNTPINFIAGLTINNEGTINFTGNSTIDITGTSVLNNLAGATVNALATTNFKVAGGATINNWGTLHLANFENEDGFLNNNAGGTLIVDRNMNNHGAFTNNGDFQIPCTPLAGLAGTTTCSFRVGDKGVGKEFISNSCIKVNGNVTFDGPGTVNAGFDIEAGYNLTINKTVTGIGGSFLVKGGTSTINVSGSFVGTNMKFYDVNTAGNNFDSNFNVNTPSNYTVSSSAGCSTPQPCSVSLTATPSTCTPATNTYGVSGNIIFANAPTTGTLTVSVGGITQVFNAPFTSPQAYSLTGLTSDGASHTVTAIFSATPACTNTTNYTSPVSCLCPVTENRICAGESFTLTAQAGMTNYQWYTISGTDTTAINGATNQTYIATAVGKYIWKAKDGGLCDSKLCCPVEILLGTCYGSIGDYVWTDQNNNGQQDNGEVPISGVKIYLLDGNTGAKLDSTFTNPSGKYLFDSLLTGSYKVQFVAPVGTIAAKQNTGVDVTDSDANKLGLSQLISIDTSKLPADTLRNNLQIDAGFVPVGSLGDYVFEDKNGNGIQEATDMPIAGIKVYLLDGTTGAKLDSISTNNLGKYLFDSLLTGSYKVQFVIPAGSEATIKTAGGDTALDSNINPDGTTDVVNIDTALPVGNIGRNNPSIDAGIKPAYGSIGDYVWTDQNNNGQQDNGEVPISGVKIYLLDGNTGAKLDSTFTNPSGKYLFDSLLTGSYKVQFVAPVGTIAAKQNTGVDVTDSDANKAGLSQLISIDTSKLPADTLRNNPQIDAGFVPVGSLGDYVFEDLDKSNTQTAGDTPLAGVKIYLLDATTGTRLDSTTSDLNGLYLFDSLLAGNYKVQFVAPSGTLLVSKVSGIDITKDSNPDPTSGITDAVVIDTTQPIGTPARDNRDVDAGIRLIPAYGSIGDFVWIDTNNNGQQDGNENPIVGVKVYLYDATGTTKLDSTLTDGSGNYLFDSLITGNYKVKFIAPIGTISGKQNMGADISDSDANANGWSQIINIDVTKASSDTLRNNPQIDAGFVPVGSIGDFVFEDKDNSNTQTAGDLPINGVKVYLLDATSGAKLDSTFTNASGLYKFDSLAAGSYKVQFVIPTGMLAVTLDSGSDDTKDSDINTTGITGTYTIDTTKPIGDPARDITTVDAGLKGIPQYGSIGDYVWFDNNNNGLQDGSESSISGVRIYLYDAAGITKLDSTLTDGSGKYLFDSLLTGNYKIKFVTPVGTIPAKQNIGADITDSDANKLGWSQIVNIDVTKLETDTLRNNLQIDAGFVPVGSLGDYVFQDKDNSNTQTTGDVPIPCIKVYLLDANTGAKLDSTMTDITGMYLFDSLLTGNYKVQFIAPIGGTFVTKITGGDIAKDSNPNAGGLTDAIFIDPTQSINSPERNNRDLDAGLKIVGPFGSIGDFVWLDTNNNGQQDASESPISGVKIYLYDGTGTMIMDSTTTDVLGKYNFDSLFTGAYQVRFIAPSGTISAKNNQGIDITDSDANKAGWSQIINIDVLKATSDTLRNNPQIDAGFVPFGSLGDYVFEDKDHSNTQTVGDLPVQGVKVYLLNATTGAKLDSTITDGNGLYLFDSLLAGNYKVQFVKPEGTNFVSKASGTDTSKDSNPDPTTGISDSITIDTSQPIGSALRDNRDIDAGIKPQLQYGSIGDYVWTDTNNNGQQDGIELPISGVKVYLYDAAGLVIIDSTLTNTSGKYLFDSLLTGGYRVKFVAPVGSVATKQNTGADVNDSDVNKGGWSQIVNIDVLKASSDTLRNNPQIDAGFIPFGSIGDYVFFDKDNSSTQSAGDTPISGVKVYLLDASTGIRLDSTITDSNGLYKFDSLLAGDYKVQFIASTGTTFITKDSGTDDTKDSDAGESTGITAIITVDTSKPLGNPQRNITSVDAGLKALKVDLSLKKTADGNCKRKVGDIVTFKIVIKRDNFTDTDVNAAVKDSLSANFQFINAVVSEGSYNNATGIWSNINLAKGDSATLTITAKIKVGAWGLVCNDAWISFMDKEDFDSVAGNKMEAEDDFARACVSVPLTVCTLRGEKVEIEALPGYDSYQWYKDGQLISGATNYSYLATTFGEYTVTINGSGCFANTCCPIYIEEVCDCPAAICLPFIVQKTKGVK